MTKTVLHAMMKTSLVLTTALMPTMAVTLTMLTLVLVMRMRMLLMSCMLAAVVVMVLSVTEGVSGESSDGHKRSEKKESCLHDGVD